MKNLTTVCKDFELTEAIKDYLEEKMTSLNKFINESEDVVTYNVRLGKTSNHHNHGKIFFIDTSIHTPSKNYGARVESHDIYAAIDELKDELAESITTYKDKSRDLNRKEEAKFKEQLRSAE